MHYEMGEALLHLYRIKRLESMRGTSPPTTILATLWDQTSIHRLHQHGHGAAHRDPTVALDPRASDRLHETYLEPALQHFRHARRGCCLLPKVHLRLALLSFLTDDPGIDALHLRRARATAPSDPEVWAECGRLEMQAGRHEIACADWRHCLSLDPALVNTAFDYAANWIDTEVLVREALPESPQFLLDLATTRFRRENDEAAHRLLVTRARQALDRTDLEEAQRCYFQAVIETLSGDVERAISYYSKAIPLRPNELAWRYQYAELLLSQGNLDEAHVQIRWCARMEPESAKYRRLLEQITQGRLRRD
jgi:tetratricopeptide (TPR) repeat protein